MYNIAVYGNKDCIIINLDTQKKKVLQTVKLDLMLSQLGDDLYISDLCWIPTSQSHLAIMTKSFIKVYNLTEDTMSP